LSGINTTSSIVTYDFETEAYMEMKSKFSKPRARSSCGLIKDANGRQVVAVVGGATGGQGMEFWYPGRFSSCQMKSCQI